MGDIEDANNETSIHRMFGHIVGVRLALTILVGDSVTEEGIRSYIKGLGFAEKIISEEWGEDRHLDEIREGALMSFKSIREGLENLLERKTENND